MIEHQTWQTWKLMRNICTTKVRIGGQFPKIKKIENSLAGTTIKRVVS
jgi:hypothetical protein